MGKGVAKVGRGMLNRQRIRHKGTGYNDRYFKVLLLARGEVKPQK